MTTRTTMRTRTRPNASITEAESRRANQQADCFDGTIANESDDDNDDDDDVADIAVLLLLRRMTLHDQSTSRKQRWE